MGYPAEVMDSESDGDMLPNTSSDPVVAPTALFTVTKDSNEEIQAQATLQLQAELDAYLRQHTKPKRKRTRRGNRAGKYQGTPEPVQGGHDTFTSYANPYKNSGTAQAPSKSNDVAQSIETSDTIEVNDTIQCAEQTPRPKKGTDAKHADSNYMPVGAVAHDSIRKHKKSRITSPEERLNDKVKQKEQKIRQTRSKSKAASDSEEGVESSRDGGSEESAHSDAQLLENVGQVGRASKPPSKKARKKDRHSDS